MNRLPLLPAAFVALAIAAPASTQNAAADSMARRADRARIEGSPAATVWLIEISDFQCPYCKMWHDSTYAAVKKEYVDTGKIRLAYINFPLPMHKNAMPAAQAAMCSAAQGKFWPMADLLFDEQGSWEGLADPAPVFESLAKRAGVNVADMNACIKSKAMMPTIQADIDKSMEQGVNSTPTFLIAGRKLAGAAGIAVFRQALDDALARTAAKP
jgi:protein-disulfide isomerase